MTQEEKKLQESREALLRMKNQLEFFRAWPEIYAIMAARYSELVFRQVALEKAMELPEIIGQGFGWIWLASIAAAGAYVLRGTISDFFKHRTDVDKAEKNNQLAEEIIRQGGSPGEVIGMLKGNTFPIKISSLIGWGLLALGGALAIREMKKLAD